MVTPFVRGYRKVGLLLGLARTRAHWIVRTQSCCRYASRAAVFPVQPSPQTHLVDASTEDGKLVFIKELDRGSEEARIAQMLCSKELNADPRNHSVQIIEVIDDPEDDTKSYMVMPLLRAADDPPFQFVKEIVDFVDQILEVRPAGGPPSRADQKFRAWYSCMREGLPTGMVRLP